MSLYFSLSLYILSLLVALVLVITGKNPRAAWIKLSGAVHALFLLLFFVYLLLKQNLAPGLPFRYSFLAALCSGLVAGGYILRSEKPLALKLYFSVYFLSLLFFLFCPSRFATVLSRGDLQDTAPKRIHVIRNFFLEAQHATVQHPDSPREYKLVQQFGLFHRTIRRDLSFESEPDSLHVVEESKKGITVRLYLHRTDPASALPISREITLSLAPDKNDPIQRKQY